MLTATPAVGPTTYVTINGMLSTAPPPPPTPQLSNNPGTMLAIPSSMASPAGIVGTSNITAGHFMLPPTYPPLPPNLCNLPFPTAPFQTTPFFPFFSPTGLLSTSQGGTPLSLGSPFGTPLPTLIPSQQQSMASSIAAYPSPISGNPLISPMIASSTPLLPIDTSHLSTSTVCSSQPSLLLPSYPIAFSQHLPSSSIVTSTPDFLLPLSCIGVPNLSTSCVSESTTVTCNAAVSTATLFATTNGLLPTQPAPTTTTTVLMSPITLSVVGGTCGTTATTSASVSSSNCEITSRIQPLAKIDKPPAIVPMSISSTITTLSSINGLDSVGYHRDAILDAIDKLRERKARPDFERIACLLKRQQNINPDQTQLCLSHLADTGAIACVDYKGNLSYRNPSKWRKNTSNTGSNLINPVSVSQRLVEAVRRATLNSSNVTVTTNSAESCQSTVNATELTDTGNKNSSNSISTGSLLIGCNINQIEVALQQIESQVGESAINGNGSCELTGPTLRICLDREATTGKLAKTSQGRYILDESGERKRLANINTSSSTAIPLSSALLMNKKLLPPHNAPSSIFLPPNGSVPRFNRPISSTAMIAPAGEQLPINRLHPLAAKQLPTGGSVTIAPSGIRPLTFPSLYSRSITPSGRRGRPPGTRIRKASIALDNMATTEKKCRLEPNPTSTTNGGLSVSLCNTNHGFDAATIASFPVSLSTTLSASTNNQKPNPLTGSLISSHHLPSPMPPNLGPTLFQTPPIPVPNGVPCSTPFLLSGPGASAGICPTLLPTAPVLTAPFTLPQQASSTSGTLAHTGSTNSISLTSSGANLPSSYPPSLTGHFLTFSAAGGVGMPTFLSTVSCNPPVQSDPQSPLKLIEPMFEAQTSSSQSLLPSALLPAESQIDSVSTSSLNCVDGNVGSISGQSLKQEAPSQTNLCYVCSKPSTEEESFLVCNSCKLMAHPTCLGYWPQFTQRVRQSNWQCTDCKTCNICQQKKSTSDLLVCDACDSGFHPECITPTLKEPVDSSQLWICNNCQKEGYSVTTNVTPAADETALSDTTESVALKQDTSIEGPTTPAKTGCLSSEDIPEGSSPAGNKMEVEENMDDRNVQQSVNGIDPDEIKPSTLFSSSTHTPSSPATPSNRLSNDSANISTGERDIVASVVGEPHQVLDEYNHSAKRATFIPCTGQTDFRSMQSALSSTSGDSNRLHPHSEELSSTAVGLAGSATPPSVSEMASAGEENETVAASRPVDIRAWSVDQVHDWLLDEGFPREAEAFQQQEIDGACLLLMKRMDVLTELGIKLGPAVKIYERIKRLQARCTSPNVNFLSAA